MSERAWRSDAGQRNNEARRLRTVSSLPNTDLRSLRALNTVCGVRGRKSAAAWYVSSLGSDPTTHIRARLGVR